MMERADLEQWKAKEVARLLALVERERRYYQELVSALPVPLAVISQARLVVSANRSFRQLFGVRAESLRRVAVDEVLPSLELQEQIRQVTKSGNAAEPFILYAPAAGRPARLRIHVQPVADWADEGEQHALLVVEDVSGEPATTTALATSQEPSGLLRPESLPGVVWIAHSEGAFRYVSNSSASLLHLEPDAWKQADFWKERIHPEDRSRTLAAYQAAVDQQGGASAEFRLLTPQGAVWVQEAIRVHDGEVQGWLVPQAHRAAALAHFTGAQRMDALRLASREIVHKLGNLLMVANGYCEVLEESLGSQPEVRELLGAIHRIGEVNQLLSDFARSTPVASAPASLRAVVGTVAGELRAQHIEVKYTPPAEDATVSATPDLPGALQALAHYLGTGGEVYLEWRRQFQPHAAAALLPPGALAVLTLSTPGPLPGRPEQAPFEAIVGTRHLPTGPALARAYKAIQNGGGSVRFLETRNGFEVVWPLAEGAASAPKPPVVLVADDEPGIRGLILKILQREGYEVLEAADGAEAWTIAQAQGARLNLLVTDVVMPGMNGRELAEKVHASFPNVAVLYVSGFTEETQVETGQHPPGSQFLQKPFTLGALTRKVREMLNPPAKAAAAGA
jgi:PAS domain S-box-containing protein